MSVTFSKVAGMSLPLWVFFTFFKFYEWYQISQPISNDKICPGSHYMFQVNPFHTTSFFLFPLKTSGDTTSFLMFPGGILERDHCYEMGL